MSFDSLKDDEAIDVSRVCPDDRAPWDERNDRLVEAVLLARTKPHDALDQVRRLLADGLHINARDAEGDTALGIARYHELPPSLVGLLEHAARNGRATYDPDSASTVAAADVPAPDRLLPVLFDGSAREYFRIWAVNLCLTLLTFGIFSAWAKVRKKRYFYSHTKLDGTPFQYLGQPLPILKGRIIAVLLFLLYYTGSHYVHALMPVVVVLGAILAPWVIMRSAAFNARYSAYRNMTFSFDAGYRDAALALYAWGIVPLLLAGTLFDWWGKPVLMGVSYGLFGLYLPFWLARLKRLIVGHTVFGSRHGQLEVSGGQFFRIYFFAGLIIAVFAFFGGILSFGLVSTAGGKDQLGEWLPLFLLPVYASYVFGYAYSQAHTGNLVWNHSRLGPLRFQSVLTGRGLAGLYFTNALAILVSCGLLIPWAVVRTLRYRAERLRARLQGDLGEFRGTTRTAVQAAGAEVGEMFDVDLSL